MTPEYIASAAGWMLRSIPAIYAWAVCPNVFEAIGTGEEPNWENYP